MDFIIYDFTILKLLSISCHSLCLTCYFREIMLFYCLYVGHRQRPNLSLPRSHPVALCTAFTDQVTICSQSDHPFHLSKADHLFSCHIFCLASYFSTSLYSLELLFLLMVPAFMMHLLFNQSVQPPSALF